MVDVTPSQVEDARIRVLLADDDAVVRDAIAELIRSDISLDLVGSATDTDQAIYLAQRLRPDVALLDVKMPGGGGSKAARAIRLACPKTQIVALSAYEDRSDVLEMVRAGALGYLVKGVPGGEILSAIHRAVFGEASLSAESTGDLIGELSRRIDRSDREEEERERERSRIRYVLDSRTIDIVFQPILDLILGSPVGMEALARFSGEPKQTPDVWFADAAAVGLGLDLELAAIDAALAQFHRLPGKAYVSINVSPETVLSPRFSKTLESVPSDRVVAEITEHAPVEDYGELTSALQQLRDGGARLAIDDVGSGFASLRHIIQLEPDIIKLDISLTRDIDRHRTRRVLASSLIVFASGIGASVVAEGIETEAELRALRMLGVGFGQGYYLAHPAPLA
jgi:EAL domain-containing protein (putative c-di-GMP-specific phosphodiesterase class I)/CheY-like chemotaxis protein